MGRGLSRRVALLLLVGGCGALGEQGRPAPAMPPPPVLPADTGVFFVIEDGVTIAMERFARSSADVEAELEVIGDVTLVTTAALRPDASVARLEIRVFGPDGAEGEPIQSSAAEFPDEGVVRLEQPIGEPVPDREAAAPPGAVPYLNPSPVWLEQILRRARMLGGRSVDVPVWIPGEVRGGWAGVDFDGDSASIHLDAVEFTAHTDAAGRLLSASSPRHRIEITRR